MGLHVHVYQAAREFRQHFDTTWWWRTDGPAFLFYPDTRRTICYPRRRPNH